MTIVHVCGLHVCSPYAEQEDQNQVVAVVDHFCGLWTVSWGPEGDSEWRDKRVSYVSKTGLICFKNEFHTSHKINESQTSQMAGSLILEYIPTTTNTRSQTVFLLLLILMQMAIELQTTTTTNAWSQTALILMQEKLAVLGLYSL